MGKLWRIWKGASKLELSNELAYRFNFLLKVLANVLFSIIGPIVTLLIYTISSGIPGWSFEEFLLFNGTFLLATSLTNTFFFAFSWRTLDKIWLGTYDIQLIRPARPLALATATSFDPDFLPHIAVAITIVSYSLLKLGWAFNIANLAEYILLIGLAVLFLYSLNIIVTSLGFFVTRTGTLLNILDELLGMGKNPLTIYGYAGTLLLTFVFPIGLAAFYPASALLGRLSFAMIGQLMLVGFAFFGFSLFMWNVAIKKYTSAGG